MCCVLAGSSSGNKGTGGHAALHYFLASGGVVLFLFVHQFCRSKSLALGFCGGEGKKGFLNIRTGLISYVYYLALVLFTFLLFSAYQGAREGQNGGSGGGGSWSRALFS